MTSRWHPGPPARNENWIREWHTNTVEVSPQHRQPTTPPPTPKTTKKQDTRPHPHTPQRRPLLQAPIPTASALTRHRTSKPKGQRGKTKHPQTNDTQTICRPWSERISKKSHIRLRSCHIHGKQHNLSPQNVSEFVKTQTVLVMRTALLMRNL